METTQALNLIKNALDVATQKGTFNLQDAATIFASIVAIEKALAPKSEIPTETEPEA